MNLEMYAVCATHGICEADPFANGDELYPNGAVRCLCDDGYTGDICEESVSNDNSSMDEPSSVPGSSTLIPSISITREVSDTSTLSPAGSFSDLNTTNNGNVPKTNRSDHDDHMIYIWILIAAIIVLILVIIGICVYQRKKLKNLKSNFVLIDEGDNQTTTT